MQLYQLIADQAMLQNEIKSLEKQLAEFPRTDELDFPTYLTYKCMLYRAQIRLHHVDAEIAGLIHITFED